MSESRILQRIKQCLAIAGNDASSDSEIKQAMAVAESLMNQRNLTREDIDNDDDGEINVSRVKCGEYAVQGNGARGIAWEKQLGSVLCSIIGTVNLFWKHGETAPERVNGKVKFSHRTGEAKLKRVYRFYGPDEDARFAAELFEEMRVSICATAILKHGSFARKEGALYCEGFVSGFLTANRKAKAEAKKIDEQTSALIVVSEQRQIALNKHGRDWAMKKHGKFTRESAGGASGDREAYRDGQADGRQASMPSPSRTQCIG